MTHDDHPETVAQRLKKPVQFLKGVGPRIDPLLQRLGLETAGDVLFHFPRSYEDLTRVTPIEQLQGSELACVCATVEEADLRQFEGNRSVFSVILRDSTGPLRAIWFNQPFMQQKLERGQRFILYGTPKRRGVCWEMTHPKVTAIGEDEEPTRGEMLPVYPSTEGLTQAKLCQIARHVVDEFADIVEEVFAAEFLAEHQLVEIGAALRGIHMPETSEEAEQGRY